MMLSLTAWYCTMEVPPIFSTVWRAGCRGISVASLSVISLIHRVGIQFVGALGVVHFLAVQRGVEGTGHFHLLLGAQNMLVVLVQKVNGTRLDRVHLAGGAVFNRALAGHAVHRLKVVLVVHGQHGTLVDGGDVEGKAHVVVLQQQAGALPSVTDDPAPGFFRVLKFSDNHLGSCQNLSVVFWLGLGGRGQPINLRGAFQSSEKKSTSSGTSLPAPRTSRTLCSTISRPFVRFSSLMVRLHRHLITWSSAPLVSMIRPFLKARLAIFPASSPLTQWRPRNIPLPREVTLPSPYLSTMPWRRLAT